ncbi:MAG: Hsp20/alpha crystallin family protein [Anaerolineae bacterium]|nr:Hsp20/alpha crystallin family protein [Anaerolineae bacterium]
MTLMRRNPYRELERWNQVVDRFFADFATAASPANFAAPAVDIIHHDDHVEVVTNLPGVAPENISIEAKDGYLSISANVNSDETREDGRYTYRERYQGSYQRWLRMPETLNVDRAEASFENGVLRLNIPKKPEAQLMRIPVNGTRVLESGNGNS